MIVAIDGPAAAGKGTVARALAQRLGWRYFDTGAMYRAVALAGLERGAAPDDAAAMEDVARSVRVSIDGDEVTVDGGDVSDRIRAPEVTRAVSTVAAHPAVRAVLVQRQRDLIATGEDVVMEGRDIGTTVAPDAEVKIFLTASLPERARRRCRQLGLPKDDATLAEIASELAARDRADQARSTSPFKKAEDAVVLDSTGRSVGAVVDEITAVVEKVRDERAG